MYRVNGAQPLLHCTARSAMPVLLMDIRTQVRGVPHYDCAEMVFKPSEAFALEFTPHNPKDKNSILARLTYGDSIVGHVAAEACVEIAALRREYATSVHCFFLRLRLVQQSLAVKACMYLFSCGASSSVQTQVRKMPGWPRSWANFSLF